MDTHVLLWAIADTESLSRNAQRAIIDASNNLFVSVVSMWEIAQKLQTGKLDVPGGLASIESQMRGLGTNQFVPLELHHVYQLSLLPLLHRDPFDRMLISQAIAEGWTLVTKDRAIAAYPVDTLW